MSIRRLGNILISRADDLNNKTQLLQNISCKSHLAETDYVLWSSSHIWIRRFRCGDSQSDYYAHDVQHSDAWEGGKRGEEGEGKGGDRMG